eukprot:scaffold315734_cov19-Prasinocladus_malaysianus.AAC.1
MFVSPIAKHDYPRRLIGDSGGLLCHCALLNGQPEDEVIRLRLFTYTANYTTSKEQQVSIGLSW